MGFEDTNDKQIQEPILEKTAQPDSAALTEDSKWSTGLCDCCAEPGGGALGCVSIFLPCVQYGVLAERLPKGSIVLAGSFGGAAAAFFCLDVLAAVANCNIWPGISLLPTSALLHMQLRGHLRNKYNIKGCTFNDLCTAWWCAPCALAQETREVLIRSAQEQSALGAAPAGAAPTGQLRLVGNLLVPSPVYMTNAAAMPSAAPAAAAAVPCAPMMGPDHGALPATGIPVTSVPRTQVATVTLGKMDEAKPAAAQ